MGTVSQESSRAKELLMSYVSPIQDLLREDLLPQLRVGSPLRGYQAALAQPIDSLFAPAKIMDHDFARACRAGLWLYFDYFDESHAVSQDLETPEGSYWHAILHRREPDYGNAKYWFRRVGNHPVFEALREAAAELTRAAGIPAGSGFLAEQPAWDSFAFVDLCEAAVQGTADEMLCRTIQRREWDLLFDYCYRRAVGK
jgi:hypothetical protein